MFDTDPQAIRPAVGLRKSNNSSGNTQFGGHPNLAQHIEWPHDSAGRPMHHLLQLDCATLPFVDPDMPRTGTLMIFITGSYEGSGAPDLSEADVSSFAVIHQDASAADTPQRVHPETCPALGERSYAINHVRHEVKQKKVGFFQRLMNTQPKAYSGSGGTGYFSAVPLEAAVFDSHPTSDAQAVFDAFEAHESKEAQEKGLRPFQIMGYAPLFADLVQSHSEGYRACSDEKALAAYEKAADRDDILLAQFVYDTALNFDLISPKYALQFRMTRADLQARAFDRVHVVSKEHGLDGLWWAPKDPPVAFVPDAEDLTPSIALKPLTPFEVPTAASNYFGGDPQLPADLEWPVMGNGYPLGFLMQVDCATLPRAIEGAPRVDLPEFPKTGTLFLFAYDFMDDLSPESFRILYTPQDTSRLPVRTPPEALKTLPKYADLNIKTRADHGQVLQPEPKRPFEPIALKNIAPPLSDDPEYEAKYEFHSSFSGALPHEENAVPSVRLLIDWLPNYKAAYFGENWRSEYSDATNPIRAIPKSYPWRWGDIADAMVFFPHDERKHVSPEHRNAVFDADLISQGTGWKAKATSHDTLDRITDADRVAYREWLLRMDACAANVPTTTANESNAIHRRRLDLKYAFADIMKQLAQPYTYVSYSSLPTTLHYLAFSESADDLPDAMREVVGEIVRFHRSDTQLRGNTTHHKPDPDLMFASDQEGQASDGEVMLFSLASGSGLPVNWGDCRWLQVWIEAEDLAAGRFDRIRPTIRW